MGECLRAAGRPQEAIRNFNSALKLNPKLATAKFNLALTLQQLGDLDKAMLMYGEVVEMALNNAVYDELDEADSELLSDHLHSESVNEFDTIVSSTGEELEQESSLEEDENEDDKYHKYFASKSFSDKEEETIGGRRSRTSDDSTLKKTKQRDMGVQSDEVNNDDDLEVSLGDSHSSSSVLRPESVPLTTATNELQNTKPRRFRRRLLVPERMVIEAKVNQSINKQ